MRMLLEPLIIYAVLFFPDFSASIQGAGAVSGPGDIPFSLTEELFRIIFYSLPSLLLLWYLVFAIPGRAAGTGTALRERPARSGPGIPKPGAGDIQSFFLSLPGLLGTGLLVSLVSSLFPARENAGFFLESPVNAAGWVAVSVSCLATGYLEETYFRHYLLGRFQAPPLRNGDADMSLKDRVERTARNICAALVSTALFAVCHLYEGVWGLVNAFLAGIILSIVWLRFRSLHGIAWAHGLYNVIVYLTGI